MANLLHRADSPATVASAAVVAACLALSAVAQSIPTAVTMAFAAPEPGETRTAEWGRAQDSGQPPFTIQTRVPLTIVDVTVTDAKGNPVHGLKESDFTVLEDNKEMKPSSFEEHRSDVASPAPIQVKQKLPPGTFTNVSPNPPQSGPLDVLLIDSLNTPFANQVILQRHMLDFIDKLPLSARLAVFNVSAMGRLSILQGFTSDRALLRAAISSTKLTGQLPPIEDGFQDPLVPGPGNECEKAAARGEYSMAAMNQLARYLSGMPGRKNLVWVGGSFPIRMTVGISACYDFDYPLKSATDQLARAHVVMYPLDPRALDLLAQFPAMSQPVRQQADEHLTLEAMAEETGGKALYNNNDLAALAEDAIDTGSNYYTIAYTPTNQALDTRFRTISIKVDQPNLHLDYRDGYYAVAADVDSTGKMIERVSAWQSALMRGALDATQILFKVKAVQAAATEASLPIHNMPDPKQMKPPYRHYSITYTIDIGSIQFTRTPDGNYRSAFEYGIRVYNADDDEIVNSISTTVRPIVPPAVYQSMLKTGAIANNEIDVPATGNYFLRIAVHDLTTDRVGAVEIPTASIQPSPAASQPAAAK
jgi:VWFA-related protein